METVFEVSHCAVDRKVEFATSTFEGTALSRWNNHVELMGIAKAYTMTWEELKDKMVKEYCPPSVRQYLTQELENLIMVGSEVEAYTRRFDYLTTLCPETTNSESDKMERYLRGLIPQVQEALSNCRPKTFEGMKRLATIYTHLDVQQWTGVQKTNLPRKGNIKRKSKGRSQQTSSNKRRITDTPITTTATTFATLRPYQGTHPKCNECNYHHLNACRVLHCSKCRKKGHIARLCRTPTRKLTPTTQASTSRNCYSCGESGHFKRECPKTRGPG